MSKKARVTFWGLLILVRTKHSLQALCREIGTDEPRDERWVARMAQLELWGAKHVHGRKKTTVSKEGQHCRCLS